MKKLGAFLFILLSLALPYGKVFSQIITNDRTFSFDSRFVIQKYSNKAIGQFGIELVNLATLPADLIIKTDTTTVISEKRFLFYDSHQLRNVGNGLLLFIGSVFLSNSFTFSYHELGHGTRAAAVGLKSWYSHQVITSKADYQGVLSGSIKSYDDFFSLYVSSLFNQSGSAIIGDTLFTPLTEELDDGWDGVIQTGGLNNEMLFSEFIEDELYRNGGHIGFIIPYLSSKLSAQSYESGLGVFNDVTNIVNYYQSRGYNIDGDIISNASKVSFYTSSLSYQFFYQIIRMFSGKSVRFYPWEFHGIQLPNTLFYMNRTGLSYKIRSGYRFGEWRFPIAFEYMFKGENRTEVSFGVEKQFNKLRTNYEVIIGKRLELGLDISYALSKWFMISGGYALYDKRNLHGERLIPSLENGSTYHDIYFRASLTY